MDMMEQEGGRTNLRQPPVAEILSEVRSTETSELPGGESRRLRAREISAPTENPKTMNIILEVPADAYHIEFTVKTVDENEETQVFTGRMGLSEIRQARQDYLDSVKGDYAITGTVEGTVK